MTVLLADQALLPQGWADNVLVEIGSDGRISRVVPQSDQANATRIGLLLPSPVNAHSHAFQRAMAGLTEMRGPDPKDSFWTWRRLMYRFLDQLTPDHIEAIAAFVQMEMLEAGYATNVEFHYLHHQPDGTAYQSLSETSNRIIEAASKSGIGLTLLPVHYQYAGCDRSALGPGQRRFGNTIERFEALFNAVASAITALPDDARLGVAPHSLRAVGQEDLPTLVAIADGRPIHLHLAEQVAEVEEVKHATGLRPVEWVLDNVEINRQWCMIHCTQMQPHETEALARSGAVAGLCPITESSLGDGIFDGVRWLSCDGKIAIGSDSNIRISLSEEIRTLDYSQRLRDRSRAALATADKSTGRRILEEMTLGGAVAAGRKTGRLEAGYWADLFALDPSHVTLAGRKGDLAVDCFAFAGDDTMIKDVWSAGRHLVRDGRHIHHEDITQKYRSAMQHLGGCL